MTTKTVEAEVTKFEETEVTFCDACGEHTEESETLVLDPTVDAHINGIAHKIEHMQHHATDERFVSQQLARDIASDVTVGYDETVDICYTCMKTFGGPEETMHEVLLDETDEDSPSTDPQPTCGATMPFALGLFTAMWLYVAFTASNLAMMAAGIMLGVITATIASKL